MSEHDPTPEELRDAWRGLFPEADELVRQEGIAQVVSANEQNAAVAEAIELYEMGAVEPHELAAELAVRYGPQAEQEFLGVWGAATIPEPEPPTVIDYLEQQRAHELVTQRALEDLRARLAAEQQQKNVDEAGAVIQEALSAHPDAGNYVPLLEASLMTWQPANAQELKEQVDRTVRGGREGDRILDAARAQAEALHGSPKLARQQARRDGLAGRDVPRTKAQWEAEKAARIDASTVEIAAEAAQKTDATRLGELAVDLQAVVPPTAAEERAAAFAPAVRQAQRNENFSSQVSAGVRAARETRGRGAAAGGEFADRRQPRPVEPRTIETPERDAAEPDSIRAAEKARMDQFWVNTDYVSSE